LLQRHFNNRGFPSGNHLPTITVFIPSRCAKNTLLKGHSGVADKDRSDSTYIVRTIAAGEFIHGQAAD